MLRAEGALVGIKGAPKERFCARKVASLLQQSGEIMDAAERFDMLRSEGAFPGFQGAAGERLRPGEVALRIKLEAKSGIGNASELAYSNALGLYEYQVVKDLRGNYPFDKIRIAQGIIFNRKLTGASKAEIGSETELVLVPFSKYKNLTTWQMFDDLRPNFEIPIYTPKLE